MPLHVDLCINKTLLLPFFLLFKISFVIIVFVGNKKLATPERMKVGTVIPRTTLSSSSSTSLEKPVWVLVKLNVKWCCWKNSYLGIITKLKLNKKGIPAVQRVSSQGRRGPKFEVQRNRPVGNQHPLFGIQYPMFGAFPMGTMDHVPWDMGPSTPSSGFQKPFSFVAPCARHPGDLSFMGLRSKFSKIICEKATKLMRHYWIPSGILHSWRT